MRRFSGVGGSLYTLGERLTFDTPMSDCGDGWDWRAPDEFSYWLDEPIVTVVHNGEHIQTGTVETFLHTGRIGLPCNMSQGSVSAEGTCRPISWLADGERWEVDVTTLVAENTTLGQDHLQNTAMVIGTTGVLYGVELPITDVLARFPSGIGVFTGIGTTEQVGPNVHIDFKEGVEYDFR